MLSFETGATLTYDVDDHYRLIAVDAAFATFAVANGAPELQPPACLGHSVLGSIADEGTAQVYKQLFDAVRRTRQAVQFPIRCDSPTQRRFLELRIEPRPVGFRIRTLVTRVERRPAQPLYEHDPRRPGSPLRVCSWCARVDAAGRWRTVEEAVQVLRLFEHPRTPPVTHGMCEQCFEAIQNIVTAPAAT